MAIRKRSCSEGAGEAVGDGTVDAQPSAEEEISAPGEKQGFQDVEFNDDDSEAGLWVANYERKKFEAKSLFPPATWVPAYLRCIRGRGTQEDHMGAGALPYSLTGDAIAGFTVGAMLVPQSLAFALLAGLPVQIGLYASFAPLVLYALLGTIRQVQPGPTALMSLLTGQALDSLGVESDADRVAGAALLAVTVGAVSVLMGAMRVGFIVDFMSHSVMAAFCSAAGITIGTSQLKHLLGIDMPRKKYWWKTAKYLISHLDEVDPATCAMGASLLVILLLLKSWKTAGSADARAKHRVWRCFPTDKKSLPFRGLKFVADLSSVLCVVVGWFWGLLYRNVGINSVALVGTVEADGFKFALPDDGVLSGNFFDGIFVPAAVMAVVGFLETMAVGGKFAMQARYEYDPNQELLALGLSNVGGGLMSGYPITGSFSRTAVNAMFGATSLAACGISSIVVFLSVYILLGVVAKLPLASLAPIIIQGAMSVVNVKEFLLAWGASKAECGVMVATLIVSLALTVKEGLLVGFALSVLKTMSDLASPNIAVCGQLPDGSFRDMRNFPHAKAIDGAVVVRMDARLSFANSRKMKEFCMRAIQVREGQRDHIKFLVIDAKAMNHVDLTGCEMLEVLAESLKSRGQSLIIANLKGATSKCLTAAHVPDVVRRHGGHLCIDMDQAIAIVQGDESAARTDLVKGLAMRVDTASKIIQNTAAGPFYACQMQVQKEFGQLSRQSSPKEQASTCTPSVIGSPIIPEWLPAQTSTGTAGTRTPSVIGSPILIELLPDPPTSESNSESQPKVEDPGRDVESGGPATAGSA